MVQSSICKLFFCLAAAVSCALSASMTSALPPGMYGLTGDGSIVITRVYPNATVELVANSSAGVAIASNLYSAPTPDGQLYALALTEARNMTVLQIDLATATVVKSFPTPLAVEMIVGTGNEIVYVPDLNAVVMVGTLNVSDPDAPHIVGSVDMSTGAWKQLASVPGKRYFSYAANFAGYSPKSRTFWFQLRNYTTAGQVAALVNVDTGALTLRNGCETDNGAYDPQTDSFITIGVYRNGTTIADVWRAQMSMPADGSSDCVMSRVLYNELNPDAGDFGSIGAFDTAAREYYMYTGGAAPFQPYLVRIAWDSGVATGPIVPSTDLPDSLLYLPPPA